MPNNSISKNLTKVALTIMGCLLWHWRFCDGLMAMMGNGWFGELREAERMAKRVKEEGKKHRENGYLRTAYI